MPVAELTALLTADDRQFNKTMDDSVKKAKKAGKEAESGFAGVFGKAGSSIKDALAVGAVVAFTKGVFDMGGELQDASDRINLNVDSLQGLTFAFGQSGASSDDFQKGMVKLNQSLDDARDGNDKLISDFEKLGISFKQVQDETPEQILYLIADAMKNAKNPTEALAAAIDILGKSGSKLVPGLKAGSDALRELGKEAAKLSAEEVSDLDEAGDALDRFGNKVKVWASRPVLGIKWLSQLIATGNKNGTDMNANFPPGWKPSEFGSQVGDFSGGEDASATTTDAPRSSARGRKLTKEENDLADEGNQAEKEANDLAEKDLERRQKLWLEIRDINEEIASTTKEAARDGMSSQELIKDLTRERVSWLRQAEKYERDIFNLHEKDAANARLRAAKLQKEIEEVGRNQPKDATGSFFDQKAEEMMAEMKSRFGFSTFQNAGQPKGGYNESAFGFRGFGVGTLGETGGLSSGGLISGGHGSDAWGKVRRGDARRAKDAASGKGKDPQLEDIKKNTADMVKVWTGGKN